MFGDLGLGRVLEPRLLQTRRGAGAWQRRKWVSWCAVKCLGTGFWVDPTYPNAPNSSWCLLLVSLSLNIFLLILCVSLSNPFPVSDSYSLYVFSSPILLVGVLVVFSWGGPSVSVVSPWFTRPYTPAFAECAPQDPAARGHQSRHRDENSWCCP